MARLTTRGRKALPSKDFAGPGRSFPIEDRDHAEKAEQLAPRSERAGNITKGEEMSIERKAHAKLKGRGTVPRGEAHQESHREPRSHAEFERLGNPGKMK